MWGERDNMIYVDSKELSPQKKLASFLNPDSYTSIPNLEAMTGADIMISPNIGLPKPTTELWVRKHIESGAHLAQIKIAHDLPQSIQDDRMKESQSKMLQTGAMPWQCILLPICILTLDENGLALINKQHTYGQKMTWKQVKSALSTWRLRGGSVEFPLSSGKQLNEQLVIYQEQIDKIIVDKEIERLHFPQIPAYHEETMADTNIDPVTREWFNAQNLVAIDDSRNGMMAFPQMSVKRVDAIWKRMGEHAALDTFIGSLYDRSVLKVLGIGEGLWEKWVRWGCNWGDKEVEDARKNDKIRLDNTLGVIAN